MNNTSGNRLVPILLCAAVPVFAAAIVPFVVFSLVPYDDNVFYEFPWAKLAATFFAGFLSIGLAAAVFLLPDGRRTPSSHVLGALLSGAAGAGLLLWLAPVFVIVRLEAMLVIWAALLVIWVLVLLRSLRPFREHTTLDRERHDERTGA